MSPQPQVHLPFRPSPRRLRWSVGVLLIVAFSSCTTVMFLEEEDQLYIGSSVSLTRDSEVERRRSLESELEQTLRPSPNTTWMGFIRPWLWVHYVVGEPEQTGVRSWVYERFAEEPVLFHHVSPDRSAAALKTFLFNRGYFESEVEYTVRERGRRATVDYEVSAAEPYRLSTVIWPQHDDELSRAITGIRNESLLTPGDVYQLENLRRERLRIDRELKNLGFFAFAPEYLLFEAERDFEDRTVSLRLTVPPDAPPSAGLPYRIGTVTVYADHSPGAGRPPDTATVIDIDEDFRYIELQPRYRPAVVTSAILFQPGDVYSRQLHLDTIGRLMSLGTFRFVNIRYDQDPDTGLLHADVLLTPSREKTVEGEIQAVTRSSGFAGPGVAGRYQDRNTFSGTEQLTVDANAGFETLMGTNRFDIDSYEIGIEASLAVPRIAVPFGHWAEGRGSSMPRTTLRSGYSILTRVDTYRLDQISGSIGYEWNPRSNLRHDLRPVDVTLVRPGDFSSDFQELLDANPGLQRSFEEQFIIGGSYRLFFSHRSDRRSNPRIVINVQVDSAGNLLALIQSWANDRQPDPDDPFTILETPYSQFVRVDTDTRYYQPVTAHRVVAARFAAGAGYALGNSASLPRVKQFSIGGTNSLRAFQGRTIGPGSLPPQSAGGPSIERSSDLRLEASVEYRFRIAGFLKGALFFDAGNIWSLDPEATGDTGRFEPEKVLEQTAAGAGLGLRIDADFIVLRLDVAAPLRKPWLAPGERWVAGQIDLTDQQWRRENLVFNIAIGYPF